MCSEVMRTPNIPLPLCLACQSPALLHMSFIFQVVMDSFRPSENRPGFRGCLLHFHVRSLWLWNIVSVFFVSLPSLFLGNVPLAQWGPLTYPLRLLLVKTLREAPYQSPGRRGVVALCAHTEPLIEPLVESGSPLIRSTASLFAMIGLVVMRASRCDWLGKGRWRAGWRWGRGTISDGTIHTIVITAIFPPI